MAFAASALRTPRCALRYSAGTMSGSFMGVPFTTNQKAFIVTTCIGGFSYFGFRLQQWLLSKYGQDIEVRAVPCPARAAHRISKRVACARRGS